MKPTYPFPPPPIPKTLRRPIPIKAGCEEQLETCPIMDWDVRPENDADKLRRYEETLAYVVHWLGGSIDGDEDAYADDKPYQAVAHDAWCLLDKMKSFLDPSFPIEEIADGG